MPSCSPLLLITPPRVEGPRSQPEKLPCSPEDWAEGHLAIEVRSFQLIKVDDVALMLAGWLICLFSLSIFSFPSFSFFSYSPPFFDIFCFFCFSFCSYYGSFTVAHALVGCCPASLLLSSYNTMFCCFCCARLQLKKHQKQSTSSPANLPVHSPRLRPRLLPHME